VSVNRIFRIVDSWLVPGVLIVTWVLMYVTSNVHGIAAVVTLGAFAIVVALWATYRELRVHAAASRHAAQGEPDELIALAERELGRRWRARGRVPFHLYLAIGHQQRGEWSDARAALASPDLARAGGGWARLLLVQRIAVLAQAGDVREARRLLDQQVKPAGPSILAREAEARVLIGEGRLDEALALLQELAKDMRIGPAMRATTRWLASRCLADRDPAAARASLEDARRIAPKLWFGAGLDQKAPDTASPPPPST